MKIVYSFFILIFFSSLILGQSNYNSNSENNFESELNAIENLTKRVEELEERIQQKSRVEDIIKLITIMITIGTLIAGIYQYAHKNKQDYKRQIWDERKQLYFKVTDATSRIAISKDKEGTENDRNIFWSLYWGNLSIIEDQQVLEAMVDYGNELKKIEHEETRINNSNLKILSFKLAKACRNSLKETWQPPVEFGILKGKTQNENL